jgi:hypothetical protein
MPPDNGGFTLAVYLVIPVVFVAYTISLWLRAKEIDRQKGEG